jgi:hypothetical protein
MVDFLGLVIGLLADPGEPGSIAHPGTNGMNVKVATHEKSVNGGYEQSIKRGRIVREKVNGTH